MRQPAQLRPRSHRVQCARPENIRICGYSNVTLPRSLPVDSQCASAPTPTFSFVRDKTTHRHAPRLAHAGLVLVLLARCASAQTIQVDITPGHDTNKFVPNQAL